MVSPKTEIKFIIYAIQKFGSPEEAIPLGRIT
jgi:hypothetical protein